jgi:hypothetical protein
MYATWIFAGLFIVFGLLGLLSESAEWRKVWAGLCTLSLGGWAISLVKDTLATGHIRLQNSVIRYGNQPRLFWAAVGFVASAGVGALIAGLWLLFFKN